MAFNQYDTFKSLNDSKTAWNIRVRAQCIWKGITNKTGEFRGYNIMFIDDSSERIHAFISSNIVAKFEAKLREGQIYTIQNFTVKQFNGDETNRVTRNDKHVFFSGDTVMSPDTELGLKIPDYCFDFFALSDMDGMKNDNRFLTDVVAVIEDVQDKVRYTKENCEKSHVPFTITDGKTRLNVTFFNALGETFLTAKKQIVQEPVIVIISAAKVSEYKGVLYLTNFPATRYYLNLKHPAVESLQLSQTRPNFYLMDMDPEKELQLPFMKVAEIRKLKEDYKDKLVACQITVKKFDDTMSWYTPFCTKCEGDLTMVDSSYRCITCNKNKLYPDKRFRLFSLCSDETGVIPVIWPNEEICRITGKCVYDIDSDDKEIESGKKLPPLLKGFEKKSFKITIKLTEENVVQGSNVFTAFHISEPLEMTDTHSPSQLQQGRKDSTEISHASSAIDLLNNISSPATEKSSNKTRSRTNNIIDEVVSPEAKIQKIINIKQEKA